MGATPSNQQEDRTIVPALAVVPRCQSCGLALARDSAHASDADCIAALKAEIKSLRELVIEKHKIIKNVREG